MIDNLPALLTAMVASSLVGGASYALCREFERRWGQTNFAALLAVLFGVFGLAPLPFLLVASLITSLGTIVFCSLCMVGAWFHRRAGATWSSPFSSLLLMLTSCVASFLLGGIFAIWLLWARNSLLWAIYYAIGLLIYPTLAPLAVWIWQSLKLRQGSDTGFLEKTP